MPGRPWRWAQRFWFSGGSHACWASSSGQTTNSCLLVLARAQLVCLLHQQSGRVSPHESRTQPPWSLRTVLDRPRLHETDARTSRSVLQHRLQVCLKIIFRGFPGVNQPTAHRARERLPLSLASSRCGLFLIRCNLGRPLCVVLCSPPLLLSQIGDAMHCVWYPFLPPPVLAIFFPPFLCPARHGG